jgi:hypothetical protein
MERVRKPPRSPRTRRNQSIQRLIVAVSIVEAVAALLWLISAYGLAEQLVADQEAAGASKVAKRTIDWWLMDFDVTLNMSLLIVGAAAGAVGSVIHQSMTLTRGTRRAESRSVSRYVLRPLWSALLGSVSVIAVNTGLISIGDETTSTAGVTVLVTMGALSGLFTNQALRRLRPILGGPGSTEPIEDQPPAGG